MPLIIWRLLAPAQMALIWWLSSRPAGEFGELPFAHADKVVHMVLFGALAFFWLMSLTGRQAYWIALVVTMAWGGLDEWHQASVPGRFPGLADWLFDVLGALLAVSAGARLRQSD